MVKKLKAKAKDEDRRFADAVRISAQQIWQAGLGAFAKAQKEGEGEGGGGRAFHALVQEGTQMQQRDGAASDEHVAGMTDTVTRVADGAAGSWDKLEQVFEERVGRALGAIGVPSRGDVEALARQVERLAWMVEQLGGGQALRESAGKASKKSARTTAKTAAPREPAAKKARAAAGAGN